MAFCLSLELRSIVFYDAGDLGEPVLLSFWIPLPCLHHPHHIVLPDFYCDGVLPALWRGVEQVSVVFGHVFQLWLIDINNNNSFHLITN